MMFHKSGQFDSIKEYTVNPFGCYFLKSDLEIPQLSEIDLIDSGFNKVTTTINTVGELLLIQDTDRREILYDLRNSKTLHHHQDTNTRACGFGKVNLTSGRDILCSTKTDGVYKRYIYNVDRSEFTEFCKVFNRVLNGGKLLLNSQRNRSVARVDLEGSELWNYNIEGTHFDPKYIDKREKLTKLNRILGAHNELLWLANNSNELYALDIETGEKVFSSFDVGPANYFSIDKKRNRLASLDREYLRTVDLSDGNYKLSKIEMGEVFDELDLRPDYTGRQLPIADNHLVFCDKFKSVVGTVDIDTGEVDWVFDLFETRDYAMIRQMEYYSDKLYVLDNVGDMNSSGGTLHIFDRVS